MPKNSAKTTNFGAGKIKKTKNQSPLEEKDQEGRPVTAAKQSSHASKSTCEASAQANAATQKNMTAEESSLEVKQNQLKRDNEELYQRLLRLQAELENFRKRTEREKQEFFDFALADFLRKLLPVMDAFERGLDVEEGETVENLKTGFQLIFKTFTDVLVQAGLEAIVTSGESFDPNRHQAMMREETEAFADNQIISELQGGYTFKGRLLRPSMVKVSAIPSKNAIETQKK